METAKRILKLFQRLRAPPLQLFRTKYYGEIPAGSALMAVSNAGEVREIAICNQYLGNDTKQSHSYTVER